MEYTEFLERKRHTAHPQGIDAVNPINPILFDFQRDIVKWALKRGSAAIFADCGLGKTFMQLEWAKAIQEHTNGDVLILAPLAVAQQTVREAEKLGINYVRYRRSKEEIASVITITNYEMMDKFDPSFFNAVVLDESSCLKQFDSKYKTKIIESFKDTPYKLACTATPAPNDFMELGNHAEFLGAMSRTEMLSMFFVHDGGETQKWRLKGHAEKDFWEWVASWAVMIRKPSDLGYTDRNFVLPPINYISHVVDVDATRGFLFPMEAKTLQERISARKNSVKERVDLCAKIVNADQDLWIVWCNLNSESNAIAKAIDGSIEILGSMSPDEKENRIASFLDGSKRVLVTKPSICGYGLNLQHCHKMAFVGLSDSFEDLYQATRRCWRFGQTESVDVRIITAVTEGQVLSNIRRKEQDADQMATEMVKNMKDINSKDIHGLVRDVMLYKPVNEIDIPDWLVTECV